MIETSKGVNPNNEENDTAELSEHNGSCPPDIQQDQSMYPPTQDNEFQDKSPEDDTSKSIVQQDSEDDDFQVVLRKKGKVKLNANQPMTMVTRNSLKAKSAQKNRNASMNGCLKGDGGAPQGSTFGDT